MNKNLKTISFAFAMFAVVGMMSSTSTAFADDEIELEAFLFDPSGNIVGEAEFEVEDNYAELEIEIPSLPYATCDVNINGSQEIRNGLVLDDGGEVEIEDLPADLEIVSVTVDCGGQIFTSGSFVSEIDEEDDEDDDDYEEIESLSNKKPKKNRG